MSEVRSQWEEVMGEERRSGAIDQKWEIIFIQLAAHWGRGS